MFRKFKRLEVMFLFFVMLLFSSQAFSAGFQLFNELSARGTAMGGALTARDDIAETAWFNPAAVSMLDGFKFSTGAAFVIPQMKLEHDGTHDDMKDKVYPVPNVYASMPIANKFGVSMAVNVPYGLTTEWQNNWPGKYYAVYTELRCLFLSPALSFKPYDWVAFGVGPNLVYATADMRRAVTPQVPGLKTNMKGTDWAYGYTLSMLLKPFKGWNLGVTYHSQIDIDLEGTAKYNMNLPPFQRSQMWLDVTLPRTVTVGISTTALKNWNFTADFVWTDWSSYDSLDFQYEKAPGTGMPGVFSAKRNWEDAWAFRFGTEYTLNEQWQLRGGFVYDQSPIKNEWREPTLPTNDRWAFSVGTGWNYKNFGVDAAYGYVLVENGGTSPATPVLDGTYKGQAHVINLSLRWSY